MINLKDFFDAKVQFGHKTSSWSPQMKPYIWGAKNKIHLIDISKTAILLERASQFLREVGKENKQILLVGTKKAAQPIIKKIATELELPYVINRWIGGTLSNFSQVKKAMTRYLHLNDVLKKSSDMYTKKELSTLKKEIARLEKNIGGILSFSYPPAAIFVVDAKKEHAAVHEALRLNIPVIAIVDTNTDPRNINFVIPGNDDSPQSIEFLTNNLMKAFAEGKTIAKEEAQRELAKKAEAARLKKEEQQKKAAVSAAQNAEKIEKTEEKLIENAQPAKEAASMAEGLKASKAKPAVDKEVKEMTKEPVKTAEATKKADEPKKKVAAKEVQTKKAEAPKKEPAKKTAAKPQPMKKKAASKK